MAGTKYQELLDAVEQYYGSGSDQWLEVAKYGTTADDFDKIVNQLPGYRIVQNQSGKTIGYEKFDSIANSSTAAAKINSNVQGAATKVKIQTPATTGIDGQTAKVTATKGISTAGIALNFVSKEVVPAVCATSVGISVGKTIDSALYNANPDFWDSIGMQGLDPSTWSDITMEDKGGTAGLFNFLFGINKNNSRTQPYIDEQAMAYMALYMAQNGFIEPSSESNIGEIPEQFHIQNPIARTGCSIVTSTNQQYWDSDMGQYMLENITTNDYAVSSTGTQRALLVNTTENNRVQVKIVLASTGNFTYHSVSTSRNNRTGATWENIGADVNANVFVHGGRTVYYGTVETDIGQYDWGDRGSQSAHVTGTRTNYANNSYPGEIAWILMYNEFSTDSLPGVGEQDGAVIPQINPAWTVAQTLAYLQQLYPGLWNQKVEYPVLQPDGTVQNYNYVPVAYPQVTGQRDNKPTGGTQYITQAQPWYDPATMPDEYWKSLWDIINNEDEDVDDDEGDGDTPIPIIPDGSASALYKIYNPSQAELDAFGAWLWSPAFVDQLLKLFNDPMQAIIGLHKVFVTPPTSGSGYIKVGYLTSSATANYVSAQYTDVDCGSVDLEETYGSVFDYEPYTRVSIYLPFIGIRDLNVSDVMRGSINVVYHVDVLTGACLAEVKVTRDSAGGTLYTFSGNCAVQYPVSSGSYIGIITGALGIAGSLMTGSALPAIMHAGASIGSMRTKVEHSGNLSGNSGAMGIKKPYLIVELPQTRMPVSGETIEGLPENKTVKLNQVSGYVTVKKCHYDGIPCTANELDRIKELLANGIYIN